MTIPSRAEAVEAALGDGLRIAAVLPYHYPRALLRAHGLHPVEVWGPPGHPRDQGARHFQAYTCDIVLRASSFLIDGGLDIADVVLVPHTCDALQGLGSVAGDFLDGGPPVATLYLPRSDRASDREYLVAELERLSAELAAISGINPTAGDWEAALAAESAADAALAGLYDRRNRLAVSDRRFYEIVRSREYLTAEEFCRVAAGAPEGPAPTGPGIVLSGIVPEPMSLFDRIAGAGARVVGDDLACGSRRLYPQTAGGSPFERMADQMLGAPPDPTRGTAISARARHLTDLAERTGAVGVLVFDVAFCEPELFHIPLLREALRSHDIPMFHVEVELSGDLPHSVLTRIEAFLETVS